MKAFLLSLIVFLFFTFLIVIKVEPSPMPMFTLEQAEITYQIKKSGEVYWLQKIGANDLGTSSKSGFNGSAVKIRGANFALDDYLEQDVFVTGIFSTETGEHTYYLNSIKKICD